MKRRDFIKTAMATTLISAAPIAATGKENRTMDTIKVMAVQMHGYDKMGNIQPELDPVDALIPHIEKAGTDKADLLVFPEYHLGRIRIPGPETERIGEAVCKQSVNVIVGGWELLENDRFANAALLFGRDGSIVGKYYKTHAAVDKYDEAKTPYTAPPPEHDLQWFIESDPEWKMERGRELPVFELDFGRIGILTCYDGWFPEPWRILSLKGAEIIVWINGRHGNIQEFMVQAAMFRNEVHVVATNQAYGAGTMIGHYPGRIDAHIPKPGEGVINATLDMKMLRNIRAHSRNLAQRRPDLYGVLTEPEMDWERYTGVSEK